ncbi:hypothetical protein KQI42_19105 [Tissierella sp. MSJ-40]|uniref:B3/B4 tRNA-binding domain-containing protein n=1 Tax=Tissierella simiarum TaxID=2841534 RepID=A0ABS6EC62_9FIRM|nr:phenylalanine--tRNA ligase beta subunit-related protein [Tissierella simiarum]MBU5440106.1 hypothetical protein [Tissierella simiarum]
MKISISNEIYSIFPKTALGVLSYRAFVEPSSKEFTKLFEDVIDKLSQKYSIEEITKNPHIISTRQAYKALGKSPQQYRNAAEAMLRRIIKGKGLYHVNNIVDINNLISITSGYSIGSYDTKKLKGNIELRRAESRLHYDGIGKDNINIEHLPTLYDELGAFGNPTSDSKRAMIQSGEKDIISVIYAFDGDEELDFWMEEFSSYLKDYYGVIKVEKLII